MYLFLKYVRYTTAHSGLSPDGHIKCLCSAVYTTIDTSNTELHACIYFTLIALSFRLICNIIC